MNKTDREKIYIEIRELRKDRERLKKTLDETTNRQSIIKIQNLMFQIKVKIRLLIAKSKY